eukprot:1195359-Prorocentrum_minimum.AAC.1
MDSPVTAWIYRSQHGFTGHSMDSPAAGANGATPAVHSGGGGGAEVGGSKQIRRRSCVGRRKGRWQRCAHAV